MNKTITLLLSLFLPATSAFAAVEAVDTAQVGKLFGGLLVVVAVIFWGAWLAKKFSLGKSFSNNGNLKIVSMMSLGTKEKILLLEVGDEQIVIGSSAQGLQHLHTLKNPIATDNTEQNKAIPFSSQLKKFLNKTDDSNPPGNEEP